MMNTKKPKRKSKQFIQRQLETLTLQNQKTLLKRSCVTGYLIPKELLKALNNLLLITYANDQVGKGLAAIIKDDYSFLPNQQRATMILELMWENEEILGNLKDFFEEQTEPFWF